MVQDWGGPIGLFVAAQNPSRVDRLVIGNTFFWPVNGDRHFEMFSRAMGGPIGKFAIREFNAFVNVFVPAGMEIEPLTAGDHGSDIAGRFPRPSAACRAISFRAPFLKSRAFMERCAARLPGVAG